MYSSGESDENQKELRAKGLPLDKGLRKLRPREGSGTGSLLPFKAVEDSQLGLRRGVMDDSSYRRLAAGPHSLLGGLGVTE